MQKEVGIMVLSLTFQRVVRVSVLALMFFLIFQVSGFVAVRFNDDSNLISGSNGIRFFNDF